jgi:hypothetical protein
MNLQTIKYFMGVSMPFMLTFASLTMIIIVGINGVPGNFMGSIFKVDITNLQIPSSAFNSLTGLEASGTDNITAASVGLADKYAFYLWNYASTSDGKETFHDKNFDYVSKIDLPEKTINASTSSNKLSDIKSSFRNKIRFAEYVFLAAIFNAFFVILVGIVACFGKKFRLCIVFFFTGITTLTMLIFAALITVAGLGTNGDLGRFKQYGLKSEAGTSDLGVVWLAVTHMVAVCIMWSLMAAGVMKMNPSVLTVQRLRSNDEELLQSSSGGDFSMVAVGPK